LHARAFTHQAHIWLGADQSPEDVGLMAHEAAHVVQQGASRPLPPTATRGGQGGDLAGSATTRISTGAAPAVQRGSVLGALETIGGGLVSGAEAVGGVAVSGVRFVGKLAGKAALYAVRQVSPELADLIDEGPFEYIKRFFTGVIKGWISSLLGGISPGKVF